MTTSCPFNASVSFSTLLTSTEILFTFLSMIVSVFLAIAVISKSLFLASFTNLEPKNPVAPMITIFIIVLFNITIVLISICIGVYVHPNTISWYNANTRSRIAERRNSMVFFRFHKNYILMFNAKLLTYTGAGVTLFGSSVVVFAIMWIYV